MKKIIAVLLVLIGLSSCNNRTGNSGNNISVDVSKIKHKLVLNCKADNVQFVALETNDESCIGHIDKILRANNHIYILDREITKSVYIFNDNGKFISKIRNIGKGPGEYIEPYDFIIDQDTGNILILDVDLGKVLLYNENIFQKEFKLNQEFFFFEKLNDNYIGINNSCFEEKDCFKILIYDSIFNLKDKFIELEQTQDKVEWDLRETIFKDCSGLYISEAFSNTIYHIDNNLNRTPYLNIDFGKNGIDLKMKNEQRDKFLSYLDHTDKAFLIDEFKQNNQIRYFSFVYKHFSVFHLMNIDEPNQSIMVNSIQSEGDMVLYPKYLDDQFFYFKVSAEDIVNKYSDYKVRLGDISETSNPILVKIPVDVIKERIISEE
jgi:hypothetical protein